MRQRICIAMALLPEPDLLIADEPTTALDATLEVQVIHLLEDLQRDVGCSMLFISHHLGVVAELCDRVAIMYAGEVVERGTVRDIFHDARHPYARKLLECDPGRIAEPTRRLAHDPRRASRSRPRAGWLHIPGPLPGALRALRRASRATPR